MRLMAWRRSIIAVWVACHLVLTACGGDDDGGGLGGGSDAGSGRACFIGGPDGGDGTVIASPALECSSRICLHVEGSDEDACTAECEVDRDCVPSPEADCTEFVCTPVVALGPFACQGFCVCASEVPEGGFDVDCAR